MVLIDTAGMAQRDSRTRELLEMLSHRAIQRLLVVNASAQGETIEDVLAAYAAPQLPRRHPVQAGRGGEAGPGAGRDDPPQAQGAGGGQRPARARGLASPVGPVRWCSTALQGRRRPRPGAWTASDVNLIFAGCAPCRPPSWRPTPDADARPPNAQHDCARLPDAPLRVPLDQADGLRRLFAGRGRSVLALVANPHVPFGGVVLERAGRGAGRDGPQRAGGRRRRQLAGAARTGARWTCAACIEPLSPRVSYLAARGLPLRHVDTRGSSAPSSTRCSRPRRRPSVLLVHAGAPDLARLFSAARAAPAAAGRRPPRQPQARLCATEAAGAALRR